MKVRVKSKPTFIKLLQRKPMLMRRITSYIRSCNITPIILYDLGNIYLYWVFLSYIVQLDLNSLASLTWQCMFQKDIRCSERRRFSKTRHFPWLEILVHKSLVCLTFTSFALWFCPIFSSSHAIFIKVLKYMLLNTPDGSVAYFDPG